MDLTGYVCEAVPDLCMVLRISGILLVALMLICIFGPILFKVLRGRYQKHQKCPKCGRGMEERAFDRPVLEGSIKRTYRDFYLVCGCGYTEKAGESELVV